MIENTNCLENGKKRGVYFCLKISICLINSDVTFKEMGTIIQTVDEFIIDEIL